MKDTVVACGLEPDQLERLDQALPNDYALRVEDYICDGVYSDAGCCLIYEAGVEKESIQLMVALWSHIDKKDKVKTIWIGSYPPIRTFWHYKRFEDVLQNLEEILEESI